MKTHFLHAFACVVLCSSCGTFTHVSSDGSATVQAGVLSSIQQVTVQVTPGAPGHPPTITVAQTGYDGTSVANNLSGTIVPVAGLKYGSKSLESGNKP